MSGSLVKIRNIAKAWLLLIALCAAIGLVPLVTGDYRLLSIFVFAALLLAGAGYFYADRIALGMVGARELVRGEAPVVHTTVERLAAVAGVPKPKLYVIQDAYPRALSAGRGPRGAAVALSRGALTVTTPAELEGLLAHELAHIRNRDVLVQTAAVVIAATLVEMSRIGGWLQRALLFALGPVAASIVHLLLSPKREFEADRTAAAICDSPHGLADALLRLDQVGELIDFRASPATEPLYTVNPFAEEGLATLFVTHPPLDERVRRLRALDPGWREKLRAA